MIKEGTKWTLVELVEATVQNRQPHVPRNWKERKNKKGEQAEKQPEIHENAIFNTLNACTHKEHLRRIQNASIHFQQNSSS